MDMENWLAIMKAYGFSENWDTAQSLLEAHQSPSRYYHTTEHISACLKHLEAVKSFVDDWKSMALAFWFHDAVYKPFSSKNERESADWAMQFLEVNAADREQILHVEALIMATCHNTSGLVGDVATLVDIDLSILGARPEVYDTYSLHIRKEYRLVPKFIYKKKRKALLQSFLDKSRIYTSHYFFEKLEKSARLNLDRELSHL